MRKNLFKLCVSLALALPMAVTQAEDIDLFTGNNPSSTDIPNVLFVVDNTANWNSPFTAEMGALASAFSALPVDASGAAKFRVGVMMFSQTGSPNANSQGGYVRAAIRSMDKATQAKYGALISNLNSNNDKAQGGEAGVTMAEVYRYLSGGAPVTGTSRVRADYTGNSISSGTGKNPITAGDTASNAIYALPGNALSTFAGTQYTAPASSGCAGTFVIYISNGPAQDSNGANGSPLANSLLQAAGGDTTPIVLNPSGSQDTVADEWSRFLYKNMGVRVFTLDVLPGTTGQGPGWSALLQSMANVSNGTYFPLKNNATLQMDMTNALNDIFSKIQSVNSAFATVSLPMSVNTQGSYLNQLFVGMFRPDGSALPRWNGNIKQYKLGLDASQNVQLQDAAGAGAIDLGTGFINACALSFWTNVTKDAYWAFNPSGNCLGAQSSNSPDGNVVEKGAQAYMLRSLAVNSGAITRTVKTCSDSNCTALANFDTNLSTTAVPPSAFGASITTTSTPSRDNLINWARGVNNAPGPNSNDPDLLALPVTSYPVRPMVHGDVVHSRPVAINYGTDALAGRQVVVYYGGNDGMLRAVNGNPSITANGVPAGGELWSFMPPEFYGNILRLYNNSPQISYPGLTPMTSMPTPQPKTYGMDGPVTAYRSADGQKTWLYASMRRGGRAIYAFDVSSPAAPTLKWKLGCPHLADDTGCSTGFSGIGQTWSAPKSFTSIGYSSGASPMLVFGGGYDKCEDADPANCTSSNKGNQIYVVDANTGSLLKSFSTARGVVGEVTVVNNAAGQAQIAYAADLGGNVYRIDGMASGAPGTWTLTQVASLGCDTVTTCSPNRKFMFAPDVVQDSGAYVILIGSGDREKPLRSYTSALSVANRFYMLVDKPTDATWLSNEGPSGNADCGQGLLCQASLLAITSTATPAPADLSSKKGWYLTLAAGEQVVTASVTAYGTTTFDTHIPSDPSRLQSCKADLGMANVYNVAYTNAAGSNNGRFQNVTGGGLAPSPWLGPVQFEDGSTRDVCVGCSASSFLNPKGSTPQAAFKQPKGRVYWFIQR